MDEDEDVLNRKAHLAVIHFHESNYRKSLTLFSEIIATMENYLESYLVQLRRYYGLEGRPLVGTLVHPKLLDILDQRTACYEKLENMEMAYRDVKHTLETDPTCCKGYLRLGKLYLKEKRDFDAYKTFQRGVFAIERAAKEFGLQPSPKLFAKLKTRCSDLNRELKVNRAQNQNNKLAPGDSQSKATLRNERSLSLAKGSSLKRTEGLQRHLDKMQSNKRKRVLSTVVGVRKPLDPIKQLPPELIQYIFGLVPSADLLKCHLVSRVWYSALTSMPRLYRDCFVLKQKISSREYFSGLLLIKKILRSQPLQSTRSVRLGSTKDPTQLAIILESLVSDPELQFSKFEVINCYFSMDFFLRVLEKRNFAYQGLASIKHLRWGINSSLFYAPVLFEVFPNLEIAEILVIDNKLRGNTHGIINPSEKLNECISKSARSSELPNMRRLSLINHPALMRDVQTVAPNELTYESFPSYLQTHRFPNLVELRLVNYDMEHALEIFSHFLHTVIHLKVLYLENNSGITLRLMFQILLSAQPRFMLHSFTFREKKAGPEINLSELIPSNFVSLSQLIHLDLYGSSLSAAGLERLLLVTSVGQKLHSLNLGRMGYLQFRNDLLAFHSSAISFSVLFSAIPTLRSLVLAELDIDNLSMRLMATDLAQCYGPNWNLDRLDLSLCHLIDGVGLVSFLGGNMLGVDSRTVRIGTLVLNGCNINDQTLSFIKEKGLVAEIQQDPFKTKWRQFGINSHILELS